MQHGKRKNRSQSGFFGAGSRTWTCMREPSLEPESSASANSAIPAYWVFAVNFYTKQLFEDGATKSKQPFTKVTLPKSSASANSAIPANEMCVVWRCLKNACVLYLCEAQRHPRMSEHSIFVGSTNMLANEWAWYICAKHKDTRE